CRLGERGFQRTAPGDNNSALVPSSTLSKAWHTGDGQKKTGRNIDRACGHLRGQDFKRRQTRGLTGRFTAFPVSQSSQAQGCSISSRVMNWHITALDLGVRQKRGSKPNYLGNRASLIAFSICGTASGQNRFATS